ncbi:MAG: bifunctional methylenetetrahydrofolate dehydrogenase/methenyltetrahydrofolate cyclohydrolase, partial [Planctomycetes bacterium]|nr:bifunctional methylenetetrahydrofolate dehydrogenase/methenyltetrahydrofolate cyclohydrolase [Planctomycetota bacterium]
MPAQILDGREVATRMRQRLREARDTMGSSPVRLISLEVGQNPAAVVYVRNQQRAAAEVGIDMEVVN